MPLPPYKPVMNFSDFSIPSNGSNVAAQINSAISFMNSHGGGKLQAVPGGIYGIESAYTDIWGGHFGIVLLPGVSLDGLGATLTLNAAVPYMSPTDNPWSTTAAVITADVALGATSFTVNTTVGFSSTAWQKVLFRGADSPIDTTETSCCIFAYAKASGATTILLDRPVNTAFSVASVVGADNKMIVLLNNPIENITIENFKLVDPSGGANAVKGVHMKYAQNVTIRNIDATDPAAGLVVAQFCDNLLISNSRLRHSAMNGISWKGRGFTISQCRNTCIDGAVLENFEGHAIFTEFYSLGIKYRDIEIINNFPGRDNVHTSLFFTGLGSQADADNVLLAGGNSYFNDSGGQPSTFTWNANTLVNDAV